MKAIKFKGHNVVFAEHQEEYNSLPALKLKDDMGNVISCWELSFKERLIVLFTGKMWMNLCMFGQPLTPSFLSVKRKEVFSLDTDKLSLIKRIILKFNLNTK